ncbi:MAG TPA: hypothetical protein VGY31_03830 [Terriglobia bacterium]|nr:hypothetical protein [Terriglobia bacterium]
MRKSEVADAMELVSFFAEANTPQGSGASDDYRNVVSASASLAWIIYERAKKVKGRDAKQIRNGGLPEHASPRTAANGLIAWVSAYRAALKFGLTPAKSSGNLSEQVPRGELIIVWEE